MATAINAMKPVAVQPRAKKSARQQELPDDGTAPAQDHEQRLDRIDGGGVEADADYHRHATTP